MACVRGDPATGTNTTVGASQCSGLAMPAEWQVCNAGLPCAEGLLDLVLPAPGSAFSAGDVINITWNGGLP